MKNDVYTCARSLSYSLLFSSAAVYGMPSTSETGAPLHALDARLSALEAQMNDVSLQTVNGNYGAKTAAGSSPILGHNWFFTADALWWHINEGGNDYALLLKYPPVSGNGEEKNRKFNFKWNWGFRVGAGKTFAHDRWDLYLNFTWFRADNSSASSLHGGAGLIPTLGAPIDDAFPNLASQSKIHWDIRFYTLDLTLGRHYFISPKLACHPFIGLKTGWIDQHQRTTNKMIAPQVTNLSLRTTNDFWGIGPNVGVEGKWFLGDYFHLFGSVAGALLWGDFDVHQVQHSSADGSKVYDIDFDIHRIAPMTQMQLGIGYETNMCHNQYHIAINARYEQQYWWQQNQMPYFPLRPAYKYKRFSEDLSVQGLTIDVRFDF